MKTLNLLLMMVLLSAGIASAQTWCGVQLAHFEGYTTGSNPSLPGAQLTGRGLVTLLRRPLIWTPVAHEYTWVIGNLISQGSVLTDSVYRTEYTGGSNSIFSIYEDPSFDATGTFYNCPSDIQGADPRYTNGTLYLKGHIAGNYVSTFDTHSVTYGQGIFDATVNWDSGSHFSDMPAPWRNGWSLGGSSTSNFACIPKIEVGNLSDYDQGIVGTVFETEFLCLSAKASTWGSLRRLYR